MRRPYQVQWALPEQRFKRSASAPDWHKDMNDTRKEKPTSLRYARRAVPSAT